MSRWRHKKRGTTYTVITSDASFQCSGLPDVELSLEDEPITIYQSEATGAVYCRPTAEFQDGRFERLEE